MSETAVCPECKTRPVPAGHYLCGRCEAALVKATAEPARQPFAWPRLRMRMPRLGGMGKKATSTFEAEAADKQTRRHDRHSLRAAFAGRERPRWLQYSVLTALVLLGTAGAWGARLVAERTVSNPRVAVVHDYVRSLADSWRKLIDSLQ